MGEAIPRRLSWWSALGWSALAGAVGGALSGVVLATWVAIAQSGGLSAFWAFTAFLFGMGLSAIGGLAGVLAAPALKLLAGREGRMAAGAAYSAVVALLFVVLYWGLGGVISGDFDPATTMWSYAVTAPAVAVGAALLSIGTAFRHRRREDE
ncbi:hypothetical protein OH146_08195 [Salinibacterium sp. SYSU T00001]|uniref:hypothetical protein n=1 Tax=Homoserinimonas sedimenticola TaxID=2986805 RepID=UPI002235FD14|nr:hypothetical protein [Salinibacterium sedimenticola]MCW4385755.1 hypothetical protein [Salinibacterium sedimenticola]